MTRVNKPKGSSCNDLQNKNKRYKILRNMLCLEEFYFSDKKNKKCSISNGKNDPKHETKIN